MREYPAEKLVRDAKDPGDLRGGADTLQSAISDGVFLSWMRLSDAQLLNSSPCAVRRGLVVQPEVPTQSPSLLKQRQQKRARTMTVPSLVPTASASARPRVSGKFVAIDSEHFFVRGVTYGTFRPDADGNECHQPDRVEQDFAAMAGAGINSIRVYTVPPRWLLDTALRHGLRVMVGVPWEQHITFLEHPGCADRIERAVRAGVAACAGHPAVLCYAIGNEIPAAVIRWQGRRRVERFIERLYRAAKDEDPEGLVTYASFPTTEYLCLPFLDLVCFNVYLESQDRLEAYLARLHNLAGNRPLIMGEIGIESRGNGELKQARVLEWQIRTSFAAGCAGVFVFSWTDEWWRGGHDVEDWDFGLTDRARNPKPAMDSVRQAFANVPLPAGLEWPRISVVVCSRNGSRTIRDCLDGLQELVYPNYEVIVVNDGSTDETGTIAGEFDVHLITTTNFGLSHARNLGMRAATGEIVAYTDDDARPDPYWLTYLAAAFRHTSYDAIGGPNIAPAGDGPIAACVANAPGGPVHVLLSDTDAEHIPGCNMAFRKTVLEAVGGFDPQFHAAGDDVDICWRLQDHGFKIGFTPAAFVWHHSRNAVQTYWRQQRGYGTAEALLERKWPERYNGLGHLTWAGRVYANPLEQALTRRRGVIHHGVWGAGLFQSLYQPARGFLASLPRMPEWYLGVAGLALLSLLGLSWPPLLLAVPILVLAVMPPVATACLAATEAIYPEGSTWPRARLRLLTAFLHAIQPLARLTGRTRSGLTPWRLRGLGGWAIPFHRSTRIWSEVWQPAQGRLEALEAIVRSHGAVSRRGAAMDTWDLTIRTGVLACVRLIVCVEEHGQGRQFIRIRSWPAFAPFGVVAAAVFGSLAAVAWTGDAQGVALTLTAVATSIFASGLRQSGLATAVLRATLRAAERTWSEERPQATT